jgi:hypothetical protein
LPSSLVFQTPSTMVKLCSDEYRRRIEDIDAPLFN